MKRILQAAIVLALWTGAACVAAQNAEVNLSVAPQRVATARQGHMTNLSIMDGHLYLHMDGMMYAARLHGQTATALDVDAALATLDDGITYVVRHPATGRLYFTKTTHYWRSTLYEYQTGGRRAKIVEVPIGDFGFDVCHPVFTRDGTTMVFSSCHPDGAGGQDLWYAQWDGSRWGSPKPLGSVVNSSADDRAPFIDGDYLYFSSNRGKADSADYDLYACRLVSVQQVHGDTVNTYPIGMGKVQRIAAPFSTANGDGELVYDEASRCGFWVARSTDDTTRPDRLYSFAGQLAAVRLTGTVRGSYLRHGLAADFMAAVDTASHPLDSVEIAVHDATSPFAAPLYTVRSDAQGRYVLYLQPHCHYRITYRKAGYFATTETVATAHDSSDMLYGEQRRNVQLQGYRMDADYLFDQRQAGSQLFAPAASATLSSDGSRQLRRIAQFLTDNPQLHLYVTMVFTERNEAFNRLLAYSREDAIQQYLWRHGVPAKMLNDTKYETIINPGDGGDSLSNAVMFFFSTEQLPGATDNDLWNDNAASLRHFIEMDSAGTATTTPHSLNQATQQAGTPTARRRAIAPTAPLPPTPAVEEEEPAEIRPEFRQAVETKQ